ncbi:MAG: aminotransferase class I/II-fold pyridoxal phosphate-dependent enzyme [Treponema sp.]|nr:aminotransferase class I/II-fold pyridoxal phosphate-dependent enzyme [Treponema sp.]
MISPLAQELNDILSGTVVDALLSELGRRMYFPRGIISQGGEASLHASKANGTIGMTVINGVPAELSTIKENVPELSPREVVAYEKTAGNPEFRKVWKDQIIKKNPLLEGKVISTPIVVPGLTAAISYVADLFVDKDKPLLAPNPCWDNYELICKARRAAPFHTFTCFEDGHLSIPNLETKMWGDAERFGSVRVILNFPQNPSGYSPTHAEVKEICRIVKEIAEAGKKVLVLSDDAYFGLNYEEDIESQSLFAYLADIHENVLAIKADGPTKEDFAWGLRCGFITFASKGLKEKEIEALQTKFMGVIRSSVSCASTPSQSLLMHALKNPEHEKAKLELRNMLQARYNLVRKFVSEHTSSVLTPLPFNSGYFMSFHVSKISSESLRRALLESEEIGVISIDEQTLRVAFSSIDEDKIEMVYDSIYKTAERLANA